MTGKVLTFAFFAFFILTTDVSSQSVELKVKSLSIESTDAANPFSTLRIETDLFSDTAGGAWGLTELSRCFPCRAGEVVSGSRNSVNGIRFGRFLGNGITRFYELRNGGITTESKTIPFFASRNRPVKIHASARIFGDLEVYDQTASGNRTTLYTAAIDLSGNARLTFSTLSAPVVFSQVGYVKTTIFLRAEMIFLSQ